MTTAVGVFIHSHALCESADVGDGTRIWAFAHVMKGSIIGRDCNIGDHTFVESGARIGDRVTVKNQVLIWDGVEIGNDVFIGPAVSFTNDRVPRSPRMPLPHVTRRYSNRDTWLVRTSVQEGASIGARSVVLAGVIIGSYSMVAAGAVVVSDITPHALVSGAPAKQLGWVCRCGSRLRSIRSPKWQCPGCGEMYATREADKCTSLELSS